MMYRHGTKLKKNDEVIINTGREKGKTGRILSIDRDKGRVLVKGVNMLKKAVRKKNQNDRGGIIEIEGSIHISNVQLFNKNGKAVRVRYKIENGKKQRVNSKTGEVL